MAERNAWQVLAGVAVLVAAGASAPAALVARWDFDLPAGASVGSPFAGETDPVGGLVASGSGTTAYGQPAPGAGGTASLSLSGGAYVRVPDAPRLTGHDGGGGGFGTLTIDLYLYLDALPTATVQILRKTGLAANNNPGVQLYLQANGGIGFGLGDAAGTVTSSKSGKVVAGQWQHIVADWDGTVGRVAVDGVDTGVAVNYARAFVDTDVDLAIGGIIRADGTTGQKLTGLVDAVQISGAPVPEPATGAAAAIVGLLTVGTRRRSRRG
jgi:hypothetical protein